MPVNNFTRIGIGFTLKNFRQLISTFPRHEGSVSVVSANRIQTQIRRWRMALPNVTPYYAVKCNPEPMLLKALYEQGLGFDCASLREVYDVQRNEEKVPDIIYAHPMKSSRDICMVDSMGIDVTVVDSVEECVKLEANGWRGSVLLRLAVEDSKSKMPFSMKFGASKDEVFEIVKRCRVPISGVSFHVGSGCENMEQYEKAIEYSMKVVIPFLRKAGHIPTTLDIGGGFSSKATEFEKAANSISGAIHRHVGNNMNVIAEPGRYMAQPCQDLFVKIIAKKPGLYGRGWRYVMDESLYSHFSCIPFDHQRPAWLHIPSEERAGLEEKQEGILFGRTCDSLDVIAKGMMEPMEVGDWLYFPLMGAYTSATASEFNGFPKPVTIVDNGFYLPDVDMAWNLVERIHTVKPLTYSNALPALSHMQPLPLNTSFTT